MRSLNKSPIDAEKLHNQRMSTVKTAEDGLTSKSQKNFGSRFFKFHKQMVGTTSS